MIKRRKRMRNLRNQGQQSAFRIIQIIIRSQTNILILAILKPLKTIVTMEM